MLFEIDKQNWALVLENHIGFCGKTKRLNNAFISHFLNSILSKFDINCEVICRFNWFKSETSRKKISAYWRGGFFCNKCSTAIKAHIQEDPTKTENGSSMIIEIDESKILNKMICKETNIKFNVNKKFKNYYENLIQFQVI